MPRHLISDAYEWINKIPSVPIYYLAKPQPRERAWQNQRGKKTLLSLTLRSRHYTTVAGSWDRLRKSNFSKSVELNQTALAIPLRMTTLESIEAQRSGCRTFCRRQKYRFRCRNQ
ncbi:hypothetical protein T4E_3150 [Trichinella pseudospiralis]|uniref:Uncharacterized protein n=1 Tax=Trichinella pseudospiralis TaxID=6337 RepID=A0A0V0XFF3_TRIPS|nr:hypothetical protein T4E_3150 [Trichinella pseudospiralis]